MAGRRGAREYIWKQTELKRHLFMPLLLKIESCNVNRRILSITEYSLHYSYYTLYYSYKKK